MYLMRCHVSESWDLENFRLQELQDASWSLPRKAGAGMTTYSLDNLVTTSYYFTILFVIRPRKATMTKGSSFKST